MSKKQPDDEPLADPLSEGAEETEAATGDPVTGTISWTPPPPAPKTVMGSLTATQVTLCVSMGVSIADVRALAEAGLTFDEIGEVADAQQRTLAVAKDGTADAWRDAQRENAALMGKLVASARSRRPESYNGDFPFPNISVFSPTGEALPPLRCEMFQGIYETNAEGVFTITASYPIIADDTGGATFEERQLLNTLEQGVFRVERRDEIVADVHVKITTDTDGRPLRLVIAMPKRWLERGEHRALPSLKKLVQQLQPETAIRARVA